MPLLIIHRRRPDTEPKGVPSDRASCRHGRSVRPGVLCDPPAEGPNGKKNDRHEKSREAARPATTPHRDRPLRQKRQRERELVRESFPPPLAAELFSASRYGRNRIERLECGVSHIKEEARGIRKERGKHIARLFGSAARQRPRIRPPARQFAIARSALRQGNRPHAPPSSPLEAP